MKTAFVVAISWALGGPSGNAEKLLNEAKISLTDAIAKAGGEMKDASTVSARLRDVKGRILFDVRLAQAEKSHQLTFDAKTAELIEKSELKRSHAKALRGAKLSIAKAIEIAIKKVPGKALGAKLATERAKSLFEVKVFSEGKLFEVEVDAATGAVIEVEQDDDDDDEDEDGDEDGEDDEDDDKRK